VRSAKRIVRRLPETILAREPVDGTLPGFNFTQHMRRLCVDLVSRVPQLRHIDMDRVVISYSQARKAVRHGLQASLTPLRFEGGGLITRKRGRTWTIQRIYGSAGQEMLYLLSFCLPRFLQGGEREKLTTILHELWHIGPAFDGDLRRHPGRCYVHSHSQKKYDAEMDVLAEQWLAAGPPPDLFELLKHSFSQLSRRHGSVYGLRVSVPKLLPIEADDLQAAS